MRCIVVCQPYASAIIEGIKDVENRTWSIAPGPLAIMAGKSTEWRYNMTSIQKRLIQPLLPWENLPYGKILGSVNVIDVQHINFRFACNPWAFGPICWTLQNPRKLVTPIPYRGRQGIFHVPDDLLWGKEYIGQTRG